MLTFTGLKNKNHSTEGWNSLGLFAGVVTLLVVAFQTHYIFASVPIPTIIVPGCNPAVLSAEALAQMFSSQELPANGCVQSTSRVELSVPVNNHIDITAKVDYDLGGQPLIKAVKARVALTSSLCKDFQDSSLVASLFTSIKGRAATDAELNALMACLVAGKLSPLDLESNINFCSGTLIGLRGHADYSQANEVINSIFRIYLNRLPAAADQTKVDSYKTTLTSTITRSKVTKMISRFKKDYSIPKTPVLQDQVIREIFDYLYRGRTLTTLQTTQLKTTLTSVSEGTAIIYNVASHVRKSDLYFKSIVADATIINSTADEAEAFSFSFRALLGKLPAVNVETEYAKLLQLGQTDSVLSPLEWAIANLKSQSDYETAGGCPIDPPKPQIAIFVDTTKLNWGLYDSETCQCAPYQTDVLGVTHTGIYGGGACTSFKCPTGKYPFRVQVPKPPPRVLASAIVFGVRTQSQFGTSNESSSTLGQLSYPFPTVEFLPNTSGNELSFSGSVQGQGGNSVASRSATSLGIKPTVMIITETSQVYGLGPTEPLGEIVRLQVSSPAPTIALVSVAHENNDSSPDVFKTMFQPDLLIRKSKLYDVTFGRGSLCTYNKVDSGGFNSNTSGTFSQSSTCYPRFYINEFVTTPIRAIGVFSPYFTTKAQSSSEKRLSAEEYLYTYTDFDQTRDFSLPIGGETRVLRTAAGVWGDNWTQYYSARFSPLVIDIENKGIETLPPSEAVLFDLKGEGKKNLFCWVKNGKVAPFLTLDRNGNGQIDNVHELFGDQTKGPDDKKSRNGFDSLKKYDLNQDRVINDSDAVYSKLILWYDRNHNGISEPDEMEDLASAGIIALDLEYIDLVEPNDRFGNESNQRSVALMYDGSFRAVFDIWFVAGNSQKN